MNDIEGAAKLTIEQRQHKACIKIAAGVAELRELAKACDIAADFFQTIKDKTTQPDEQNEV